MQKTKIEWADYVWNPVKGLCPTGCWYCYAGAFYKRFKWDQTIRFDEETYTRFLEHPKSLSGRIFVGSTIDLFHPEVLRKIKPFGITRILAGCDCFPNATFIFLTKFPEHYAEFDFPENCWLGVTVTKNEDLWRTEEIINRFFQGIKKGKILRNKIFVSIEPLLEDLDVASLGSMDWIIVGALTGPRAHFHVPRKEWIQKIIDRTKPVMAISGIREQIPIFLKDNLKKVWGKKIQEFPA